MDGTLGMALFFTAVVLLPKISMTKSFEMRCPVDGEWHLRAQLVCKSTTKYFCLLNPLRNSYEEGCTGPDWDRPGSKRVFQRNFNRRPCADDRYQPIKFWTIENSICLFKKSMCSNDGQVVSHFGSSSSDISCGCDYTDGYTFVTNPDRSCFCDPFKEDCSCFKHDCNNFKNTLPSESECIEAKLETGLFSSEKVL